jgi:hypothetical protein
MTKKNTKIQKQISDEEIKKEQEKMLIISKADEVKGEQLIIDLQGNLATEKELREFALGDIQDPERMYDVYYNGIQKLLLKHLPEGKPYKKARDFIFEEKNTYLTRGHRKNELGRRGADSRMGYREDGEKILEIIIDWIISRGDMASLYNTLRDLNVSKGYGNPKLG